MLEGLSEWANDDGLKGPVNAIHVGASKGTRSVN